MLLIVCNKDRVKTTTYHFHLTIVAIEQQKLGVYETIVECNPHDGERTLEEFVLTDRKPLGM